jgi:hypothetical protein
MSKNIKNYKSEMQNVKFSPDFVSKTIASLGGTQTTETLTPRRINHRFSVIRNLSLAIAACLLCVFTVTVVMRENYEIDNLQVPEVVIPTVTAVVEETSLELIEEIEEFTPFAAISSFTDTTPLPEPENKPEETVITTTVTVTEAAVTVTTAAVTRIASADEQEAESAEDAAAGMGYYTGYNVSIPSSGDEILREEYSADDSVIIDDSAEVEFDAETEEEAEISIASSDEKVLNGEELLIDNSADCDFEPAGCTGILRYKDNTEVFLDQSSTADIVGNAALILKKTGESAVKINGAEIEFHLTLTEKGNIKYVIYLFSDALAIAAYGADGYTLNAVPLTQAEYKALFAEMYKALFSETDYELYLARESGK